MLNTLTCVGDGEGQPPDDDADADDEGTAGGGVPAALATQLAARRLLAVGCLARLVLSPTALPPSQATWLAGQLLAQVWLFVCLFVCLFVSVVWVERGRRAACGTAAGLGRYVCYIYIYNVKSRWLAACTCVLSYHFACHDLVCEDRIHIHIQQWGAPCCRRPCAS